MVSKDKRDIVFLFGAGALGYAACFTARNHPVAAVLLMIGSALGVISFIAGGDDVRRD